MLSELNTANRVVGTKQVLKALSNGEVSKVFLADDADSSIRERVLAAAKGCEVIKVSGMEKLGSECGIAVKCAVAALLR